MEIYVVKANDTVDSIAASFNISAETIIYDNQLVYPYRLAVGQALIINTDAPPTGRRNIYTNGYAYPFISQWVLSQTLPFLTDLSIFSYGFTAEGNLVPPELAEDENALIAAAWENSTRPILVLTPLDDEGKFNNNLITSVLNNSTYKDRLITQLKATITEKGYAGLDIDFEYIKATDRDSFTAFVQDVTTAINAMGYPVSVALAPKTSSTQQGILYAGKDYPAIGAAANHVLLMTYEWGYTFGPPMAVAPINLVRNVVEYAVTEIPTSKIDLGIPNYGYDWPLPYVKGKTEATTIGNVEAVQIAIEHNATIEFDETAQSPFFYYYEGSVQHVVWFEDARSIQAKLDLIKDFNLRGAGYWQIMRWWRANWIVTEDNFIIQKNTAPFNFS